MSVFNENTLLAPECKKMYSKRFIFKKSGTDQAYRPANPAHAFKRVVC